MPRESLAIPKYLGIENEFGCVYKNPPNIYATLNAGTDFIEHINGEWLSTKDALYWNSSERMKFGVFDLEKEGGEPKTEDGEHGYFKDPVWAKYMNRFLPNGGRLYNDMGHPEICTPLCRNAFEALLQDRACEFLLNIIRRHYETEHGKNFALYKNNTADGEERCCATYETTFGVSFGTHENYLIRADLDLMKLINSTLPFFAARSILFGSGKIGGIPEQPPVDFQLSQRADFFSDAIGSNTVGRTRPIFNTRDCPYADWKRFKRLHVINGDANMCEVAEFLKLSTMQILLMMVEDGYIDDRFSLNNPVAAFRQTSRDVKFEKKIEMSGGRKSMSAIDIMKGHVDLMNEYLNDFGISDELLHKAVVESMGLLDALKNHPEDCFGKLDHATKRILIERAIERGKISSWQDPRAKVIDLKYHDINPSESIFYRQSVHSEVKRLTTDREIEIAAFDPPPTRSRFQAEVHKRYGLTEWDWHSFAIFCDNETRSPLIYLDDPLADWAFFEPLLCGNRDEFLKRCGDAGLIKSDNDKEGRFSKFSRIINSMVNDGFDTDTD